MIAICFLIGFVLWVAGWKNVKTARETTQVAIEYGNEIYRENLIKKIDEWKKGKGGK